MVTLNMEHVLMFVIVAFVLYHFMGRCQCTNGVVNGFSVGIQRFDSDVEYCNEVLFNSCKKWNKECENDCLTCWHTEDPKRGYYPSDNCKLLPCNCAL